jgi:hypothetical protein
VEKTAQGQLTLKEHVQPGGSEGLEMPHEPQSAQFTGLFHPPGTTPLGIAHRIAHHEEHPIIEIT